MRVQRLPEPQHRLQHIVSEQLLVAITDIEDCRSRARHQASADGGDWCRVIDVRQRHVGGKVAEAAKAWCVEAEAGKTSGGLGVWSQRARRRDQAHAALTVERRYADVGEGEKRIRRGGKNVAEMAELADRLDAGRQVEADGAAHRRGARVEPVRREAAETDD